MSAGDAITGIFANSSVNMVILSLFFSFYLFKKENFKAVVTIIIILLTTYMSGILIFGAIFSFYFLLISKFSITKKVVLLFSLIALSTLFYFVSKDNVEYVVNISSTVVEDVPPRKLTSFQQTLAFSSSSYSNFFLVMALGTFLHDLLILQVVNMWVVFSHQEDGLTNLTITIFSFGLLVFINTLFDGTANQPFSIYNQLLGEYGFIGLIFFIIFYVRLFYKKLMGRNYARLMLFLGLGFMFLDYWYQYFSVMIFLVAIF